MALTAAQIEAIDKERKELYWDGDNLGAIKPDTLKVKVNGKYTDVGVDQLAAIAKTWLEGFEIMVEVVLYDVSPDFIKAKLMKNQLSSGVASSGDPFVGFGNTKVALPGAELLIHEYGVTSTTRTKDWLFWNTEAIMDATEFGYGGNTIKELAVKFRVYADTSKAVGYQYGIYGDWQGLADNAVPKGVWIAMSNKAQVPGVHLSAFTMKDGQQEECQCFAAYTASTYTVTAAINDATDINSTDTVIVYDTLAGGSFAVGDYILIGTEYMYVNAATSTQLTVNRAVWGSTAAAHLDNAVISKCDTVSILRATDVATWASSSTGDFTVGTTFQGTGANKIGRVTWVSTGSGNLTATVNTKASPACVVTTS